MNLDRILPLFAPLLKRVLRANQARRAARFAAVPPARGRVVFLGDSITEGTAWEDWFPELRTANRGIGGHAICDVASRLDNATTEPAAISLLIGTNDLHGLGTSSAVPDIAAQMDGLVRQIRARAPLAPLFVHGVFPRSALFRDRIVELNAEYRRIAREHGATYIDMWPVLAGPDGAIVPELTSDGLHLSIAGYKAWVDALRPHLAPFAA